MGETETTTPSTAADRAFDPTPQTPPTTAPPEASSGPAAALGSTPDQDHGSSSPWADSLAQRFPDGQQFGRSDFDAYLHDTVQPYVTQYEQAHGQASSILDTLLADDPDPEKQLSTYLALTEAAYGPEVALNIANHLVEALGLDKSATPAEEDTTVPPPDMEAWLNTLPAPYRSKVEADMAADEDAQWEKILNEQIYPAEWTAKAQDGALFSQYVANSDSIDEAFQLWNVQMKPVIEKNPELFGLQAPGAEPTTLDPAVDAAAAAAAAAEAPNVLGTTAVHGPTTPPVQPQHTSLDDAVKLFFEDIHGSTSSDARGL